MEASLYATTYVAASYLNAGYDYPRQGNMHPLIQPYTTYQTQDKKHIVVGAATDQQF